MRVEIINELLCAESRQLYSASFRQSVLGLFGEFTAGGTPRSPPLNTPMLTVRMQFAIVCFDWGGSSPNLPFLVGHSNTGVSNSFGDAGHTARYNSRWAALFLETTKCSKCSN